MALQKKNFFQRRTKPRGPRANERIHASEVQVISSDGKNLGTLPTREAIEMAKEEGLDLIEISPNAKPPVCKIIDMGKYKYELQKKTHKAKKKQKTVNLKEIKLRPVTDTHDYNFKIKNAQRFLEKGDKVKFTVRFKGREMQHPNLGHQLMQRIISDTSNVGKVEVRPKFEGRQIIMIIQSL
ncbi:MAG TPA: translation initiation factor IF-3 [Candidatus Pelagibacter sp.]|nr:translation initiation factor IF-3 [Candidatus Pelagibacter sp.]